MMNEQTILKRLALLLTTCFCIVLLAACGGNDDESASSSAAEGSSPTKSSLPAVATMPPARFAQPTSVIDKTKLQDETPQTNEGPDLALGERIYNKHCTECHGDDGQGVTDKGNSLTGTLAEEAEFDDLLRTAGQGTLGPTHQFGSNAISPSGMSALFAYTEQLVSP